MAQGHNRVTVNVQVVGSIPIRGNEIFNNLIFFARSGVRTRYAVPSEFG